MKYILWILLALIALIGVYIWTLYAPYNLPECKNTNPIFNTYHPGDKEYDAELVKQLNKDGGKAFFRIGQYFYKDDKHFITVHIQSADLCTQGIMDITNCQAMEHLIEVKGISYGNAVLADPVYTVDSTTGHYRLILQDISRIVD